MENLKKQIENIKASYGYDTPSEVDDILSLFEALNKDIDNLFNKPVETTNEQPSNEELEEAITTLEGDNSYPHTSVINYLERLIV